MYIDENVILKIQLVTALLTVLLVMLVLLIITIVSYVTDNDTQTTKKVCTQTIPSFTMQCPTEEISNRCVWVPSTKCVEFEDRPVNQ